MSQYNGNSSHHDENHSHKRNEQIQLSSSTRSGISEANHEGTSRRSALPIPDQVHNSFLSTPPQSSAIPPGQNERRTKSMSNLDFFSKKKKRSSEQDVDHTMHKRFSSNFALREQGVNVSDMDNIFGCIKMQVDITTVDMDQSRCRVHQRMTNSEFLTWLEQPRPEWSAVRWININGMSWDVIKAVAIKYDLHHLAVEDLLQVPQRTKVDIYPKQTYISCTLLTLMESLPDGEFRQVEPYTSPYGIDPELLNQRLPLEKLDNYKHDHYAVHGHYERLHVHLEQVTFFLLQEENTLITFFQVSGQSVVAPIIENISQHDFSITRRQSDVSFLLQTIMDGIVDHAIPITDAFRREINKLETQVIAMPRMSFTGELHRLSAQLAMLKRTLAPTQILVHSLRGKDERSPLTSLARTYMADVMDHCNTMVEDIDSMLALCEKLINMIFNLVAYDTNETMRRLALVSIIFLPITFIAGVYGTNFTDFPELEHNIGYFWMICGIITAIFILGFIGEWVYAQYRAASLEKQLGRREPVSISGKNRRARLWEILLRT